MVVLEKIKENLSPLIGGELRIQSVEHEDRIYYARIESFEIEKPTSLIIKLKWCVKTQGQLVEGKKRNMVAEKLIATDIKEYTLTILDQNKFPVFGRGDNLLIIYNPWSHEQLYFKPQGDENYEYVDVNQVENMEFEAKAKAL